MRTVFGTLIRMTAVAVVLAAVSAAGTIPQGEALPVSPPASPPPTQVPEPTPQVHLEPENPDPANPHGDLIEISIKKQRLTAWRDGRVVHRFVISTGRTGYETPPGHYKILEKYENRWSRKWSVWMPYAMRWYQGYFIHQLPHKDGSSYNIGASKLGRPDSHGCVRVDVGDAKTLFHWTEVGTPVWVH